jgi:hypothetical protein
MMGFNIMSASHFDEYLVDFSSFKPLSNDESVFDVPQLCGDAGKKASAASGSSAGGSEQGGRAAAQAVSAGSAVMPWAHIAGAGGSASSNAAGARPGSTHHGVQALRRLKALAANAEFVRAWNARVQGAPGGTNGGAPAGRKGAPGFKLALNRFADALPEEVALLTAKRSSAHSEQVKVRALACVCVCVCVALGVAAGDAGGCVAAVIVPWAGPGWSVLVPCVCALPCGAAIDPRQPCACLARAPVAACPLPQRRHQARRAAWGLWRCRGA